ncbi:hypothetical protein AB0F90_21210 [Micromonospora chalcea]|uniref:hypothetical protein n=1 Tax=Micromonospora chalcea TaxID=1874 RepID=UPI0033FFC6ED
MSSAAWLDESMRQRPDRSGIYVLAAAARPPDGVPPAVIQTGEVEMVRFDAARLAPTPRARVHYRDATDGERRKMVQAVASMTAAVQLLAPLTPTLRMSEIELH